MEFNPLFIGLGATAPCWYRIALPARQLGADWVGVYGSANGVVLAGNIDEPEYDKYDTIICQQPSDSESIQFIKERQKAGQKVLYEIDDFVHGVRKIKHHKFQKAFHKKKLRIMQELMGISDGLICSTEYLADQYSKYNPNVFVCQNAIDTERYSVERAPRDFVTIGWSGGTGHHLAVGPWLEAVSDAITTYSDVAFVSIGTNYANALSVRHPGKTISVPWSTIENYPYSLSNIDIAIAPSHDSKYFKSKSDLRWLEASAAKIPSIVHPNTYKEIENNKTGIMAETPEQVFSSLAILISDKEKREDIANEAHKYVTEKRNISVGIKAWEHALKQIHS